MIKLPVLMIAMSLGAVAQTTAVDLRTQSKSVDFSNATLTKPARLGATLPTTCGTGELFFNTSATVGFNLYICAATNLWQALGAGGAGGAATSVTTATVSTLPSTCNVGDIRFTTDATVGAGGFYTYWCTAANTWTQLGYVGGASGALASNCSSLPCSIDVTAAVPLKAGASVWTGYNNFSGGQIRLPESTVAGLPSASANSGKEFIVTNGASATDCVTGSGSTVVSMCRSNGVAWVYVGSGNFGCTDYPAPGALSAMNTSGHVYCLSGAYTFTAAQTVSSNNVTVVMWGPGTTITRSSGAADGFDVTGANDRFYCNGGVIDGGSLNGGPLFNLTNSTAAVVDQCTVQNFGTSSAAVSATAGDQIAVDKLRCAAASYRCVYLRPTTAAITNWKITNGYFSTAVGSGSVDNLIHVELQAGDSFPIKQGIISSNIVTGSDGSSNAQLLLVQGPSSPGGIDSVTVSGNKCSSSGVLHSCLMLFGMDHSTVSGNTFRDEGHATVNGGFYLGDLYDSTITGNASAISSGSSGPGIWMADGARNTISSNTVDGFGAGAFDTAGIALTTTAGGCSDNVVTGNVVNFINATAGKGIEIASKTNTFACNDNTVTGNHVVGSNSTGQIGVLVTLSNSGTAGSNYVHSNQLYNLKTGVEVDTGVSKTRVGETFFDTVVTPVSDSGSNSSIYTHMVAGSGALTSGSPSTLTVTLANNDVFTTGHFQCTASDQTTQANPIKVTLASGTSITLTGPNAATDTVGYMCVGY